jgi:KDO2-lipid IV(A) lauroyltransferase
LKPLIGSFAKLIAFIVANLPRSTQLAMGRFIGWLWFDVLKIRRQVAIDNVGIAFPSLPLEERTEIARASLTSMGQTLIEYFSFPFFSSDAVRDTFEIVGEENLKEALKQGKGIIMMTLHLGNGDFAIAGLSRLDYPMNLISKEFKSRWLNDLWFGMRRKHGTRFIPPEKSSFEILRALRRNEIVVFVLDQFMGPPIGVRTKFFGRETGTAMGCALMADRTHAPVVPSYTYRKPNGRHVMVFEEPIPFLDHGLRDQNIAVMTQIYTDKIESIIRQHPGQWMWIHRRWKEFRD